MPVAASRFDAELDAFIADCYADPLAFVLGAYEWGKPGTALEHHDGPDVWQRKFLEDLGAEVQARKFDGSKAVEAIRKAASKGHGVGGTALLAWIVDWIMSTRPDCQGSVTANTIKQLTTKTWPAIQVWTQRCITGHWFTVNSELMYYTARKASWFCACQSSSEENSEAFAGQHAVNSTSFYVFDEASAIPEKIFEVAEGGLTDGEPMVFMFGNPTRSQGSFHKACFGAMRHRWKPIIVDSRESRLANQATIQEWISDYGEDSDFVRVRVRGLPPSASDAQFIDSARIVAAQRRSVVVLPDEPLVAGVDFAWGGADDNVVRFRRGSDARGIQPIRIKGEFTRDPGIMTNRLADVLSKDYDGHKVQMLFLDSAGIAGPIGQRLRSLGHTNVMEVNFGADSPDPKYRYFRDYMWGRMKDWLASASIDASADLETDLTGPGLRPDRQQRVWLESKEDMKKRGLDSPDDGDALALTFAMTLKPKKAKVYTAQRIPHGSMSWGA